VSALVEAIRQSGGLTIESEKSLRTSLVETESGQKVTTELNDQIRSRSKGLIHTYDMLGLTNQDQRWMARLMVTMPQYRAPGPDRSNLSSIAVLPFRAKIQGGPELARAWEQKLVTCMVQAGRFRVVDREFTPELDREDARLRSGDAPDTELVRLGQQLGADYTVVGEITHLDFKGHPGANLVASGIIMGRDRAFRKRTGYESGNFGSCENLGRQT
jgi:TolB-like protein